MVGGWEVRGEGETERAVELVETEAEEDLGDRVYPEETVAEAEAEAVAVTVAVTAVR